MCCRFREKLLLVLHLICNIFGLSGSEEKVARREIALWCEENQWRTDRLTIANNMFTLKKKERKKKWSLLSHIVQENKLAIGHLVLTGVLQQVHNITLGFTVLKRYFWGERELNCLISSIITTTKKKCFVDQIIKYILMQSVLRYLNLEDVACVVQHIEGSVD